MSGLFAYGTLKARELAYSQIEKLVENVIEVKLIDYEIGIRDSLPVIFESKGATVAGDLIFPIVNSVEAFWSKVENHEGKSLYKKTQIRVQDRLRQIYDCSVFIGKGTKGQGYTKLNNSTWSSKYDPYLAYSFPILLASIREIQKKSYLANIYTPYWVYMNKLQEKYLLLIVLMEHIALLLYGGSKDTGPNLRITQLGTEPEWDIAYKKILHGPGIKILEIKDVRNLKDKYRNDSAQNAIKTYYQIRNNLSHQGKGGFGDCDLIYTSLIDLSSILEEYLKIKIDGIEAQWDKVLRAGNTRGMEP